MDNKRFALFAGIGCGVVILVGIALVVGLLFLPTGLFGLVQPEEADQEIPPPEVRATQVVGESVPTLTPIPEGAEVEAPPITQGALPVLYEEFNPGVVNIRVYVEQGQSTEQGAGSGFILDEAGHIVTNNHVVAQADALTVIFYNGFEVQAEIVGTDADSDLAVIRVGEMPEGVRTLGLAETGDVETGDWVVAIGNPFGLGGSMSLGIVSAVGRAIPSGATRFRIPRAIQTDAAINPGNSGGPLLNLAGEVVGVNAQIASGSGTSSGVGFAVPSDVVQLVVPALIEQGSYAWPWLGVTGGDVSLLVQQANELESQQGAYIAQVVEGGPAAEAGIQGATGSETILNQEVPVGGDVVLEANGEPIRDFTDLLAYVAFQRPGDSVTLTILRDGERQEVTVELAARPEGFE